MGCAGAVETQIQQQSQANDHPLVLSSIQQTSRDKMRGRLLR